MNKLIISICLVISTISYSQKIDYGIKAGANLSKFASIGQGVTLPSEDENENIIGFYVGVFSTIKIISKLSFQPEILYSNQGNLRKYTINSLSLYSEHKVVTHNIIFPLSIQYEILKNLKLQVGPQINYELSAKYSADSIINGTPSQTSGKISDTNKIDLAANLGVTYQIFKSISLDARFSQGLINQEKNNGFDRYNQNISFGLGYSF